MRWYVPLNSCRWVSPQAETAVCARVSLSWVYTVCPKKRFSLLTLYYFYMLIVYTNMFVMFILFYLLNHVIWASLWLNCQDSVSSWTSEVWALIFQWLFIIRLSFTVLVHCFILSIIHRPLAHKDRQNKKRNVFVFACLKKNRKKFMKHLKIQFVEPLF